MRSREALFELLDRAHLQKVRSVAREAALAQPLLGIVATADYLGKRGKNVDIARPLLRVLATSHPELLAAAIAKAGKAGAAVLRDIFADAEMPTNWAPAGAWPAVLRSPAWQSAKKDSGSLANAVVPLEEPAYEETMTWLSGEREAWLAKETGRPLSDLLRRSRVTESMIRAAVTGDSEARSALRNSSLEPLVLARLDLPEALEVFQLMPFDSWNCWSSGFEAFLAKAPLSMVIKNLIELVEFQTTYPMHHLLLPADSPRIAPRMALLHSRRRKLRDLAKSWLRRHPRAASVGLLPQALGTKAELREDAQQALRFLAAEGWREDILAVAEQYGVTANAVAILDRDPLDLLPTKIPKLPDFWDASSLAPPRLNSGESLPQQAVDTLATMLAFSRSDSPYAGITQVRKACDAGSLATFAWELFQSWLLAGAPAKENWAFLALGHLGDDSTARNLAPLIRQWPGEAAHARAVSGLEVLTAIGSDVALMLLQNIADKVKFKGLQDNARQKIEQIAEQRGLSPEELADRLAPDFGLDEDGSLELDFGARRFRVGLDERLRPFVIDLEGKRLGELPKPNKADDALRAAEALERYKTLKKDVKSFAGMQILRLEMAMVTGRRFSREVFEAFFAHHPLIRHLACRLVWAAHGEGRSAYFRVSEDGTYTDAADEAWLLPQGVEIAVPHPLDLPPELAAGFGQIFGDYEILQPFPQLGREIYTLSAEERGQDELLRFAGHELPTGKLLGLEKLGWRRGVPQDAGCISLIERHLEKMTVYLSFRDGIFAGDINYFPTQTLEGLTICSSSGSNWLKELKFDALSPTEASEILRDLERLVG